MQVPGIGMTTVPLSTIMFRFLPALLACMDPYRMFAYMLLCLLPLVLLLKRPPRPVGKVTNLVTNQRSISCKIETIIRFT